MSISIEHGRLNIHKTTETYKAGKTSKSLKVFSYNLNVL